MDPDGDTPPFWSQRTTTLQPHRRHPPPSRLLNPVALILSIPIVVLLVILIFILTPFLSHTNQILRPPNSVNKGGLDSFHILLVLFAVLCGVFARWNDDDASSSTNYDKIDHVNSDTIPNVSSYIDRPRQSASNWPNFQFPEPKEYNSFTDRAAGGGGRKLRRSSSSYPDLRQEPLWDDGNSFRFYDDFEVNFHPRSPSPINFQLRPRRSHDQGERDSRSRRSHGGVEREIHVDKFEVSSSQPSSSTTPPPSEMNLNRRRSSRRVSHNKNVEMGKIHEANLSENQSQPVPPPAAPPPPPAPKFEVPEQEIRKHQRKKSGTAKEIATAVASLYKGHTKRNKKVIKTSTPPPPPPPPPPPSRVLKNLFKKSTKSKRVHSDVNPATAPPPPSPPPPPPNSIFNNLFKTGNKSRRFKNPAPPPPPVAPPRRREVNAGKPPKPTKRTTQLYNDHNINIIIEPPSPLIPSPPPPPPFRMSENKFVARGDFVRIRSEHSSRCSSPELEDVDVVSIKSSDGGDSVGPTIGFPSPDVNAKADSFIARLRDEWRLEKMNSFKENRKMAR